ncbi:MAG: tyrosine-type recombinase/integrase [Thermoplasmatales archaeon]|nr:tyrosine-type recombinase/integrase [Thermoplasmatales archaeon]
MPTQDHDKVREEIYDLDHQYELCNKRLKEDTRVPDESREVIIRFINKVKTEGVTTHRLYFYMEKLRIISKVTVWEDRMGMKVNHFLNPTKDDITRTISTIMDLNTRRGAKYSESSITDFKTTLKKFYRWYEEGKYWDSVKDVQLKQKKSHRKRVKDTVTKEEIQKMLNACLNARDKALISLLYDSGARIGEVLSLRVRNVTFDKYGAKILIGEGKTWARNSRIVGDSVPLLRDYLDKFYKNDPDDLLFNDMEHGGVWKYDAVEMMLKKVLRRAKITRRIHAHLFRHTRITLMAKDLKAEPLAAQFGFVPWSRTIAEYTHLNDADYDRAVLKVYGKSVEEEEDGKELQYTPKVCMRCGTENPTVNQYCLKCGLPLGKELLENIERETKEEEDFLMKSKFVEDGEKKLMKKFDKEFKDKLFDAIWKRIEEEGLLDKVAYEVTDDKRK